MQAKEEEEDEKRDETEAGAPLSPPVVPVPAGKAPCRPLPSCSWRAVWSCLPSPSTLLSASALTAQSAGAVDRPPLLASAAAPSPARAPFAPPLPPLPPPPLSPR